MAGARLSEYEARAYDVLVGMSSVLSWQSLLQLREELFHLHSPDEARPCSLPYERSVRKTRLHIPLLLRISVLLSLMKPLFETRASTSRNCQNRFSAESRKP